MFSNPTGLFNLSLPDKLMRTKNYQFLSYSQFKSMQANNSEERAEEAAGEDNQNLIQIRNWEDAKREAACIIRIELNNKTASILKVKVILKAKGKTNIVLPTTPFECLLYKNDSKILAHLMKIDPTLPLGEIEVELSSVPYKANSSSTTSYVGDSSLRSTGMATQNYGGTGTGFF